MVFVLSMLAPLVAFAEEKQSPEVRCQRESLRTFRSVSATGRRRLCLRRGRRYPEFRINVKNNGNVDAHNVRIEPDIKNASDWPFELDKLNYEKELSTNQKRRTDCGCVGE